MKKYYVYKAIAERGEHKGKVVYIGKGKGLRLQHCLSGCSSSKEINKYFFLNGEEESMSVHIMEYFETDLEALKRESELIKELRPIFNKLEIVKPVQDYKEFFSKFCKVLRKNNRKTGSKLYTKTLDQVKAFVSFYTLTELQKGCKVSRTISKNCNNTCVYDFTVKLLKGTVMPFIFEVFQCEKMDKGELFVKVDLGKIDEYLNSQMLQWIWRSRIRDDKPINLAILSPRMKKLFLDWLYTAQL